VSEAVAWVEQLDEQDELAPGALEQFFSEIGRYPLLTAAEEIRLAKRIERGDPVAREQLITSNLRLVVYVAKRFRGTGVQLVDLVQEGTLGLIRAVDGYDWRRGCRFSTYATWWIRQAVQRGVQRTAGSIRLPANVSQELRELRTVELGLLVRLQRHPTEDELAEAAGTASHRIRELRHLAAGQMLSLDDEGDTASLAESVASPAAVDDEVVRRSMAQQVRDALERLPEPEQQVIRLRYGIDDGQGRAAAAVAEELGLSRDRVRKLERVALRRLAWSRDLTGLAG
jgi:RNA polymerase primary sigma factor